MIGIAGLLALFLTIVFVVKGAVIFPAAAALAWSVLAYVCIDFGFWDKIFGSDPATDRIWRAGSETVLSATLVVFLFAYLNLNRWHVRAWHVAVVWLLILADLAGLAVFDAPVAAGVARISLAHGGRRRLRSDPLSRLARLRAGDHADPDLVPARALGLRGGLHGVRLADQRPRFAGAGRRPGADRHADRLHGDAKRLRRRRARPRRDHRRRAQGAGADRRRRDRVRLGRALRPHLRQPRGGGAARARPRRAGGRRRLLARSAASFRAGPLPRLSRRDTGAAARPHRPGIPPARRRTAIISASACARARWSDRTAR